MSRNVFGWDYPAGAEHDPRAPYNETHSDSLDICPNDECNQIEGDWLDGVCLTCSEYDPDHDERDPDDVCACGTTLDAEHRNVGKCDNCYDGPGEPDFNAPDRYERAHEQSTIQRELKR